MQLEKTLALDEARERLRRTIEEYIRLDAELRALENTNFRVCIFGSARIWPKDPVYHQVFHLAQKLSERGIDVVTGGGPGLMEAANRGVSAAKRGRSKSYGLPLDLPSLVERPNRHLDIKSAHKRFSSRLDEFMRLSHAVVVAPGGIGTLLELMYVWQLLQLNAVEPRPMILLGTEFWNGFVDWVREMPAELQLLDAKDLEQLTVVDRPDEAIEIIEGAHAAFLAELERGTVHEGIRDPDTERLRRAAEQLATDIGRKARLAEQTLDGLQPAAYNGSGNAAA
jgi:uncharacterized protein (TIGR00730 family)